MAWRDSRGSRRRMLLFLSSMVLGVAALVAINSFGYNLKRTIDEQARGLLGADLSLESGKPFGKDTEALIDSLGGEVSRRVSFTSMALFPEEDTRLVSVRAVEGGFPFYGAMQTEPEEAGVTYLDGRNALVDVSLFEPFNLAVGDSVQVGNVRYRVAGKLISTTQEAEAMSLVSPRIIVPLAHLDDDLLAAGSRAQYEVFFRFPEGTDVNALAERIRPHTEANRIGYDTVDEVKENWNEGLSNLYRFLSLIGFVSLLLGALGVASAVHVYVRRRIEAIAVLRCLGARSWPTVGVFVVQALAMGVVGGVLGAALGMAIQVVLPVVLGPFLPVDVDFSVAWGAVGLGLLVGVLVTILFALLPLVSVRHVSPLRALRSSVESPVKNWRDALWWVLLVVAAGGITGFAVLQAPNPLVGIGYAAGVAVVFGSLGIVAKLLMVAVRKFFPSGFSYVWRQGMANLYRPHNQTGVMMLALGLGTFLIVSLLLVQRILLSQLDLAGGAGQADLVFFDIQRDQLEGVRDIVSGADAPVIDEVPIVTMRLSEVGGRSIEELRADTSANADWAFTREYRSSYRDFLTDAETVLEGTFVGEFAEEEGAVPPISIEKDVAERLGVTLGDTLVWDVQGVEMPSVVTSVREVDWRRVSTNFFVLFPTGVLEEAPQFFVMLARGGSPEASARIQSKVVQAFPNVSAVDVSLVLRTIDEVFGKIAFVVRFMALFSIITGLFVLAGAVVVNRYQRVEESVLLKTLGASRRQVMQILVVEYLFLGLMAALTGILLAVAGAWALAHFVFESPFIIDTLAIVAGLVGVVVLTMAVGLANSRGIYSRPPLAVLRAET